MTNAARLKKSLQTIKIDDNTSTVIESYVPVKSRPNAHGFTADQRRKSIETRKASSLKQREDALVVFTKNNAHIGKTVKALGITRQTFNTWCETFPEFAQAVADAHDCLIDDAERAIHTASNLLDVAATKFILTTKGRDRGWGEKEQGPQVALQIVWQDAASQ